MSNTQNRSGVWIPHVDEDGEEGWTLVDADEVKYQDEPPGEVPPEVAKEFGIQQDPAEKDSDEWVPYEGDQGGTGWQTVDGEQRVYQDNPPGDVPQQALDEAGVETTEGLVAEIESRTSDESPSDEVSTGERLGMAFEAAESRVDAREYGIKRGNTTADSMDILEYDDGSIDFAILSEAYDDSAAVESAWYATRNNRDSPAVIETFGGESCQTEIIDDPSGDEYIVKEGIDGKALQDAVTDGDDIDADSYIESIAAGYFVGNTDLHVGNLFVDDDGTVTVIDHDQAVWETIDREVTSVEQIAEPSLVAMPDVSVDDVREQTREMAQRLVDGEIELPEGISSAHEQYAQAAADEVIDDGGGLLDSVTSLFNSVESGKDDGDIEWVPYQGPGGGTGWRPAGSDDTDDVEYQDQPPGTVPDEVLDQAGVDSVDELVEEIQSRTDSGSEAADTATETPEYASDMSDRGYVSSGDTPDLRLETADDTVSLYDADASEGASSRHMDVARWDDGREAFVTHYGETLQRDRTGEKPLLGERAIAADAFLRNIGFGENIPAHYLDRDPETDDYAYLATEGQPGEEVRTAGRGTTDRVDTDNAKRFAAAAMVMGNSDLHPKNILVDDDGTVRPVDLDKSGGDFTSDGRFRRRGVRAILRSLRQLGVSMSRDELWQRAEDLAQDIDLEDALEGVQNSQESDKQRHQFRENIADNIEAFADGEHP